MLKHVCGQRGRCVAAVAVIALSACSGSNGQTTRTDRSDPALSIESVTTIPAADSTALPAVATTQPPPAIVPLGVRWDEGRVAAAPASPGGNGFDIRSQLLPLGDDLWLINTMHNSSIVTRSRDDGVTWQTVPVVPPPASGTLFVSDLVIGPTGRFVATGSMGSRCRSEQDLGNGYRYVDLCKRFRPVLFVSDDDGASWRQIEPPAMAPPGDSSVVVSEMIVSGDAFLAVGTVRGPDWHARLWSSPDGETWTLEREVRDTDGGPMSGRQILTDGTTTVLIADGHPCGRPDESPSGWVLGSTWYSQMRLFAGTGVGDLFPLTSVDHPFITDPAPIDCGAFASVSDIDAANLAFLRASGRVIGGVITMLQALDPFDQVEADNNEIDHTTSGSRRFTQLVNGEWVVTEISGVMSHNSVVAGGSSLIDVDGAPGIFEVESVRSGLNLVPILPDGNGSWQQSIPERPAFTGNHARISSGAWSHGAMVVAAAVHSDPFRTEFGPADVASMAVWRSVATTGDRVDPCEFGPGGFCRYVDLSTIDGYPDFAGVDLSGADLSFSDFGEADFSRANFTGATLWAVTSGEGSTFDGANFTEARLEQAELNSAVGADFSRANAASATFDDVTGATFDGTNIQSARLRFSTLPPLGTALLKFVRLEQTPPAEPDAAYEISLAGLTLPFVSITNAFDGPLLKVATMDGTTLDSTTFYGVDFTAIDPAVVDLTEAHVDEDSICPDGLPPDDPPLGTCVRGATP